MLFSSMTFLFVFMPLVITIYGLSKKEIRNYVLLIASILFYAWGEPRYLAIMILTILVNYVGAIEMARFFNRKKRKLILAATICVNLGFLIYFKYFNFIVDNANNLFNTNFDFIDVIMPIGISFYTFQAMSYLIDVYRREVKAQKDIYKLALYIVLFPQLVAGPIVKYHDVCDQIDNRKVKFENVIIGFKRFIMGLAKKVLLANTLAVVADKVFAQDTELLSQGIAWIGALAYILQLYYDFSGYSDMAIGLGLMFGFKFMENFNYPYISKSIGEFWQRWHISLSTWFKQYLYIPLGGNRKGKKRTYLNLILVFLATGIWHGASWVYFTWGAWNALFIVIEKALGWGKDEIKKWYFLVFRHIYALLAVGLGMVIFRSPTVTYACEYIQVMFGIIDNHNLPNFDYDLNYKFLIALLVGVALSLPLMRNILNVKYERKVLRSAINIWLFILFFLSTISLAASTYNPFIYFRF